jgi:hypothetical protein
MPGLPRKSTARQFKKLMGKSGKSRTNKSSGGSDPSRKKIATYEQFVSLLEGNIIWYNDDGSFEEEEGYVDNPKTEYVLVKPEDVRIGLKVWSLYIQIDNFVYFGIITDIDEDVHGGARIIMESPKQTKFILPWEKFFTYKFVMKKGLNESHELDPYDEEDWNDYQYIDASPYNIKEGDILYHEIDRNGSYVIKYIKEDDRLNDIFVYLSRFGKGEIIKIRFEDFSNYNFKLKKKLNESNHIDVDPFNEEDWDDQAPMKRIYNSLLNSGKCPEGYAFLYDEEHEEIKMRKWEPFPEDPENGQYVVGDLYFAVLLDRESEMVSIIAIRKIGENGTKKAITKYPIYGQYVENMINIFLDRLLDPDENMFW